MRINIENRHLEGIDAAASAEEVSQHAWYVMMDALSEFSFTRRNTDEYMDKRYPVESGGVHTSPADRKKKRAQIITRCNVAKTLHSSLSHVNVEKEEEMSVTVQMPLKSKRPGVKLLVGLTTHWVVTDVASKERVESAHKFPILRFLREKEVDLDHKLTRLICYRISMDLPPSDVDLVIPPPDDFNLEAYK